MSQKKNVNIDSEVAIAMVWTTVGSRNDAEKLAAAVVENRLAACVQIDGGVTSIYRWKASLETETEYRLLFKTTRNRLAELELWIAENHPYDEPEFVVTPVLKASLGYTNWVVDQTSP